MLDDVTIKTIWMIAEVGVLVIFGLGVLYYIRRIVQELVFIGDELRDGVHRRS